MEKKKYSIYRCGYFGVADQSELRELKNNYNISKVIDFNNSPSEHMYLSRIFKYKNIEMFNKKIDIPSVEEYIENYIDLVENNKKNIGLIMTELIASVNCPVLIGCKFGKDRTGIIAAMLLDLAGTEERIIAEDYYTTLINLKRISWIFSGHWKKRNISNQEYIKRFDIDKNVINSLIEYIKKKYGSVPAYLQECGVMKANIEAFIKTE